MTNRDKVNCKILLVEDESAEAHLVKAALKENKVPFNLCHATDGIEALAFLRAPNPQDSDFQRPDLIMLDINMPGMNGWEFLAELKSDSTLDDIPVIVFTSADSEKEIARSYQLGAASHIVKPTDMDAFIHALQVIHTYWLKLNRLPVAPDSSPLNGRTGD